VRGEATGYQVDSEHVGKFMCHGRREIGPAGHESISRSQQAEEMNQESNPHSTPAKFDKEHPPALVNAFQAIEVVFQTEEDGPFFIGGTPKQAQVKSIYIVILDSSLDSETMDAFHLGLMQSSVLQVLDNLTQGTIYKTDDDFFHAWKEEGSLHLDYRYRHSPGTWFNLSLNAACSELVVKWLSYHSGASRNAPCPCNSGKKFKMCCAHQVPVAQDISEVLPDLVRKIDHSNDHSADMPDGHVGEKSVTDTTRLYETRIVNDGSGLLSLDYMQGHDEDWQPLLTPAGHPMRHNSNNLLSEIQAELKAGSPSQMLERFTNYQLLCSQIDEFQAASSPFTLLKHNIPQVLMEDGAFFPMHPPEEIERIHNLESLSSFLTETFGENRFSQFAVSSPPETRSTWGRHDAKGPRFDELHDWVHNTYQEASLEQQVVIHSAFHISGSTMVALLFTYGYMTPQQFALGSLAARQIIPDMLDEQEQSDMLDQQEKLASFAAKMTAYLDNSRTETENLIGKGEGESVEFKSTFKRNLRTQKSDKDIETAALKEIVGFLNSGGGHLIIGVSDDGKIIGLCHDVFSSEDRYKTHISNQIRVRVGPDFGNHLQYYFDSLHKKKVLRIQCAELPRSEMAFLDGDFYLRNAAQTIKLSTKEAMDWRRNRYA